jgi:hypothetical protein
MNPAMASLCSWVMSQSHTPGATPLLYGATLAEIRALTHDGLKMKRNENGVRPVMIHGRLVQIVPTPEPDRLERKAAEQRSPFFYGSMFDAGAVFEIDLSTGRMRRRA